MIPISHRALRLGKRHNNNKQCACHVHLSICLFQPSISCLSGATSTCHLNLAGLIDFHFTPVTLSYACLCMSFLMLKLRQGFNTSLHLHHKKEEESKKEKKATFLWMGVHFLWNLK